MPDPKLLRGGLYNVGLCKPGVEQILVEAGTQNQETERKTLVRQILTKGRRGAVCSPLSGSVRCAPGSVEKLLL